MVSRSSEVQRGPARVHRCAVVHPRRAFVPWCMRALAHVSVLAFAVCAFGQEADRTRTEALARRATERLQELQQEADHLASEEGTLLGDLRKLDIQRQIAAEE